MAGTYSRIIIQLIFVVKGRENLIESTWEDELFKYISGIISKKEQVLIAINGVENHIHILIGMKPTCCLSDLVREIKKSSNTFINDRKFTPTKFEWQIGYGAFSYTYDLVEKVVRYIENQKQHHKKTNFRDEYIEFLEDYDISYDERYIFEV